MSGKAESSYDASAMPIGLDRELERLRGQALISWEKEARNLRWMGLRDDMRLLELGSGPGFVTEQLLGLVPRGSVVCVETDPVLIERAERYLQGKGESRLRIVRGDVMHMDLPDNSFDFAYGRYLFQHLPDAVGAAREVRRVLKPGGKVVIFDVDDALNVFDPPGSEAVQAIDMRLSEAMREEQASKGGNRLIGRRLPHLLRDAGFHDLDMEVLVIHNLLTNVDILVPPISREALAPLLADGQITPDELEMMLSEAERFEQADPAIMIPMLMAVGTKRD